MATQEPVETESLAARRALFRRMALSHFDFQEARQFLDRLQTASEDEIIRAALMTALLVSYWRPFSASEADGLTAKRLPEQLLDGLPSELIALHHKIGLLRNKQFAHTDPTPAELQVNWELREKGFAFPLPISNVTRVGLPLSELPTFRCLLNQVDAAMFRRYSALGESLLK